MEIVTLPWGERAPADSDCVRVEEASDGRWRIETSALSGCGAEATESDATVASAPYDSYEAAEAAALAIAAEQCPPRVYLSRGRAADSTPGDHQRPPSRWRATTHWWTSVGPS